MEWPLEVRILAVCASVAAIASVASHGVIIAAVAGAVYLLIAGLVG